MDPISYAHADEAHERIDMLESVVTRYGDDVTLIGDVTGSTIVSMTGEILINTVLDKSIVEEAITVIDGGFF